MLVIPVAATPTGERPFAESAGRYEHRPHIFLALPHRSFRDWRNGKCRDHALPLPFRAAFLDENRAEKTIGTSATIGVDNQLGLVLWEQFRRVAVWLIATPASQETHWGKPRPRGGVFLSAAARQCDWRCLCQRHKLAPRPVVTAQADHLPSTSPPANSGGVFLSAPPPSPA